MSPRRKEDRRKPVTLPSLDVPVDLNAASRVWAGALCAQVDPELFFPEQGCGAASRRARAVCDACPVRELCLDTFGPVLSHGVVGGLTARQRAARRNAAERAA